ncbi:MAG TPA: iron-siderophore ABC transporter substrate-binding protein [Nocardioides sp.]|nr:iron-siderophore ABC transporter substrate-binding protein [Nocardioides sp.]
MKRRTFTPLAAAGLLALSLTLAACGSDSDSDGGSDGGDGGDFAAVTIDHAFGSTEITEEPERVVTWGWGSADAVIALGVTPVAIPTQSYGGDENGLLPWLAEELEEQGADTPTMLSETEEPPYEEILAAKPDVILAQYSGITEDQYDKLSEIAPTVAYPGEAWSTPWRDVISITGQALGKEDEAEQLLTDIDAEVAEAAEAHPEFEGKTIAAVWDSGDFYVYSEADPRVEFLTDLGFEVAPSVAENDTGESTFYYTISYEETDKITSDVLLSYHDTPEAEEAFLSSDATASMQQFQDETIANVVGPDVIASVSPPTALSLGYSLDTFVTALADATANVK